MSKMTTLACASLCLFAGTALAADSAAKTPAWKPIFNGKNP